jgi:hypothetical protein
MANQTDQYGNPVIIEPNNYAVTAFGLNTPAFNASANNFAGAPRPRFLFFVRFVLANATGSTGWANGLTFAVRTADRPKIQPQVQELNQYNKKRLIQTGVKYEPVKISFYDTTDSTVMQLWDAYSNFYFGDFRQSTGSNWTYDVTAPQFVGGPNGFGFSPNLSTDAVSGLNTSSYFFDHIEVYQVYAGEYIQYNLINPKISAFDPDGFDYSSSEAHVIDMTFQYESVLYQNGGAPASISSNSILSSFFTGLPNQAYDPFTVPGYTPGAGAPGNNFTQNPTGGLGSLLGLAATFLAPGGTNQLTSAAKQIGSGVLGAFGTAVFGSNNPLSNAFSSALPGIMNGSFSGANTLNKVLTGTASNPNATLNALGNLGQNSIPAQTYSQSYGAISSFLSPSAPASTGAGLAAAVTASSIASGASPNDMVSSASAGVGYGASSGLSLSNVALGVYNQNSPSGAQVGVFSDSSTNSNSGSFPPSSDSILV